MTQKYQVKVSMKQAAIVETGIVLKQGDFGMQIEIEVLDFDATGTTPQIVFRKAMGAVESTTITVSSNKYTYTFKGTELDTPGKVFCDLKLKNSTTQRISTASFMFKVVADTLDGLAEESSSYSDTIAQIVDGFDDDIAELRDGIANIDTEVNGLKDDLYIMGKFKEAPVAGTVFISYDFVSGRTYTIVNNTNSGINGWTKNEALTTADPVDTISYTTVGGSFTFTASGDAIYVQLYTPGTGTVMIEDHDTLLYDLKAEVSADTIEVQKAIKNSYYVASKTDLSDFNDAPNNSLGFVFLPVSTPAADIPANYPESSVIQGYGALITFSGVSPYQTSKSQIYISIQSGRRYSRQYANGWQTWTKNIDTTLTLANISADAKKVGDEITRLDNKIINTVEGAIDDIGFIIEKNLVDALHSGKYAIAWNIGDVATEGENAGYAYGIADVEGLENITINMSIMSDAYSFFTDAARKKISDSASKRVGTSRVYTVPSGAKYMYITTQDSSAWGEYGIVALNGTADIVTDPVNADDYPYNTPIYFADDLMLKSGATISQTLTGNIYHVEKDGSGDFTSLVEAIQEAVKHYNSIVYIGAGTWDIIDEFGSDYMNAVSSNPSTWGLELKNNIHVIGTAKTLILSKYEGQREDTITYFSTFNAGPHGFTLENVTIEADNIRYAIHDDRGSGGATPYTNRYINCSMKLTHGKYGDTVIGGGLGVNGTIEIINCRFEGSAETQRLAYYHGNNYGGETGAKCTIILQGNYFANIGSFRMMNYGDSPLVSTAYISNNSFGSEPDITSGSYAPYENMAIVAWNNEIRE